MKKYNNGTLDLRDSENTELPEDLCVTGDLICAIRRFPVCRKNLSVDGDIDLHQSAITNLALSF